MGRNRQTHAHPTAAGATPQPDKPLNQAGALTAKTPARPSAPRGAGQARDGRDPIRYGLLGRTLGHSWSPQIHARLGSVPYELVELEPDEVADYVRKGRWSGLNVTIPYKRQAAELADERTERVRRLGVANTLARLDDGRILADNTDVLGFSLMLSRFCERRLGAGAAAVLEGGEALVLGSGGASQAVQAALEDCGARVSVISRKGPDTYEGLAERHPDAVLVVNATPVGMYPACPRSPLAEQTLGGLPRLKGVLDVIYNPERTGLCLAAEHLGIPSESGLGMLVAQALYSSELWRGTTLDVALVDEIEREIHGQTSNVVLIGMPGSGKTSCGRALGELTGRPFVDLDHAFSERYGKSAAEVIESDGEPTFRSMETEVLADYGRRSGQILSCGGGVVTRPENRDLMHQNGTVVMLDRPIEQLSSRGRPISRSRGIQALAEERLPLYRAWADLELPCTGSARGDAREIARLLSL